MLKRFVNFCLTDAWLPLLVSLTAIGILLVVAVDPPIGQDAHADYYGDCEDDSDCAGDCVCCSGECVCPQ